MASKKIPMTEEIKLKLKRDIPSLFEPKEIVIESADEIDHVFTVKSMTNLEYLNYVGELRKLDPKDEIQFSIKFLEIGMRYIVPKIISWKNGDSDYSNLIEEYIPYVKTEIMFMLFEKYQTTLE